MKTTDQYYCLQCEKEEAISTARWKCDCGGLLQIKKGELNFSVNENNPGAGLWRYSKLISSFDQQRPISLGEGNTPITQSSWNGKKIFLKWEGNSPTGSYKDRGAATIISALTHLGIKSIVEDSSGNAGAAIAWYAKAAGMNCKIFAPAHAAGGKLNTILSSGASLIKVKGERENAGIEAKKELEKSFYASHVWCPFFMEGVKTISYEIMEQMGNQIPEQMVLPLGNGTLLLGIYKGFKELLEAGLINKMPKILAVQSENCSPIYRAFHHLDDHGYRPQATIAEGIANAQPPRLAEIIQAVKSVEGSIIKVSEKAIESALYEALQKGWIIEPTSAVSLAALDQLEDAKSTLVIISGSGLKIMDFLSDFVQSRKEN